MNVNDQLCETLQRHRDHFAQRATDHTLTRGSRLAPARVLAEISACIDFLTVAVDLGAPALFANHVTWTLPALHGAGAGHVEVDGELRAIRQTLLEELPLDLLGVAAVYLIEATQRLREVAESATRTSTIQLRPLRPAAPQHMLLRPTAPMPSLAYA